MQRWEELVYAKQDGREEGEAIGEARGKENEQIGVKRASAVSESCNIAGCHAIMTLF